MKKQNISSMIAAIALCAIGFMSVNAIAGQDEAQRQMTQQIMKAKQKLKEAEAAKSTDRQKLMGEHMKMLHESMEKCAAMKPKAGMSMEESDEWYSEHQKLMEDMMGQMMSEHRMMMDMQNMPMDMGDMHKH